MSEVAIPGIEGQRVLVTGGSRGIGRAVCILLARAGASVGLAYHVAQEEAEQTLAEAREAAADDRVRLWAEQTDLSREEDVARLFERVDEEFGSLDGFVGSAGVWNPEPLPIGKLEPQAWRTMIDINLTSIYLTGRAAASRIGRGGGIVLLSSTAAQRGEADHSHYAASKGAINSFTKSLATELGPRGITVNAVAPGWVDTDMSASVLRTDALDRIVEDIPLRRVASAEDVAGPIVFLLSDLARHVTGEVLNVNGGSVLCG